MFNRGVGHDGTRPPPPLRGTKKKKKKGMAKKKKQIAKIMVPRPSREESSGDLSKVRRRERYNSTATRLKSRSSAKRGKNLSHASVVGPSDSRQNHEVQPTIVVEEEGPPPAPQARVSNILGRKIPPVFPNLSSSDEEASAPCGIHSPPRVTRRRISGQPVRVPNVSTKLSTTPKRKYSDSQKSDSEVFGDDDDEFSNRGSAVGSARRQDSSMLIHAEESATGSIALSKSVSNVSIASSLLQEDSRGNIIQPGSFFRETSGVRSNFQKRRSVDVAASVSAHQPLFVIPRGVAPKGTSNGATFTLLSKLNADVQWVENACKASSDFHLWDRFVALQVHGPYELIADEAHLSHDITGAYMSTPYTGIDTCWIHFYRFFLCTVKQPKVLRLKQDALLMTNGVLIHKIRTGDTSIQSASLVCPHALRASAFKTLKKWGLDENDVLTELLMRAGSITKLEIKYSGAVLERIGDILKANPRIQELTIKSQFPFDRLSGVASGLSKLSESLDSRNFGTARLVTLSLLAACSDKSTRAMHRQCLIHILSVAAPKCETLKTVEVIKSNRRASPLLIPAIATLIRLSDSLETIKLIKCEFPSPAKTKTRKSKGSSASELASAIGSSQTLTRLDLSDSTLSSLASLELAKSFCTAPALQNLNISGLCTPSDGREYFMKVFAENNHLNISEFMFHSNDVPRNAAKNRNTMTHGALLSLVEGISLREKSLVKLDLSAMGIGKAGATSLASALRNCFALKHFNFSENYIGSVGANAIFQALRRVATIEDLLLNRNEIGDSAAHAIATCVQDSKHLRVFSAEDNLLTNDGGSMVWTAIAKNTEAPLVQVNFSGNKFDTAWCMSNAFRASQHLETVSLARNCLNSSTGRVFADAVISERWGAKRTLTSLDLGGNNLGPEGTTVLARALANASQLQLLWLDENKLGARGGTALAKSLKQNSSLTMLDISNNMLALDTHRFSLDLGAVKEFAKVLTTNKTLKHLYLKGNQIGGSGGRMLKDAIAKNRTIQTIGLEENEIEHGIQVAIINELVINVRHAQAGLQTSSPKLTQNQSSSKRPSDLLSQKIGSKKSPWVSKEGLPSGKKKKNRERPTSPKRSASRPSPREKIMGVLFQAPLSLATHEVNLPGARQKPPQFTSGHSTRPSSRKYDYEREDEFYASLLARARTENKNQLSLSNAPSTGSTRNSSTHPASAMESTASAMESTAPAMESTVPGSPVVKRVSSRARPSPSRTKMGAAWSRMPVSFDDGFDLDPKILVAGGNAALEKAAQLVVSDRTAGGEVDVDALKRALERMRGEMNQ